MTTRFGIDDVERFATAIARRLGLLFDESKLGSLGEVLQRRLDACGTSGSVYLRQLDSEEPSPAEIRALARELTIPETYFFRNIEQFRALAELVIPDRFAARSSARRASISILSAACASGEEAYSLAVVARQRSPEAGCDASIRAIDINPAALEKARAARYSAWALRETPADLQRRWFRPEGREFVLDTTIRAAVQFEERNLIHDNTDLWQPGAYDVVFCRNVLMYFTPEHARTVVSRITRSLAPGGYLFLGHAETLRGLSHDYHLRHTHGTFYYQRKDAHEHARVGGAAIASWSLPETTPADVTWAASWIETVQRSSQRIQALAEAPEQRAEQVRSVAPPPRPELGIALDLLQRERFAEALDSMRGLPAEFARDPETLLLRAVLLTHSGQLAAAEDVCRTLLAIDDLSAGARYLLALCREGAGDKQGAAEHDQVATYLDPAFAMPRLHLGLLARRAGDRDAARRELGQALALLEREDASRLLLFGGGFSRDALVTLCLSELVAAGGKA